MKALNTSGYFNYPHNTNENMFRMSPSHWTAASPTGRSDGRSTSLNYNLKSDIKPSEAISALFAGADPPTLIECLTAVDIAWLKAMLECFGPDEFDKMFASGINIVPRSATLSKYKSIKCIPYAAIGTLRKGDLVYFFNHPNYLNRHYSSRNNAFQGENALVVDSDKYEGFGVPVRDEAQMKEALLRAYNVMPNKYDAVSGNWVPDSARNSAYPQLSSVGEIPGLVSPREDLCKGEVLVVSIDVCKT